MRVLLIGSGGREHALAWAICRSPLLTKLYCAPGNAGICDVAECVEFDVSDHAAVVRFCAGAAIDLVVVGPEGPLVAGLVDDLTAAGIRAFGPNRLAAQLEGSKGFTKDLCREAGIPTAGYRRFSDRAEALAYLGAHGVPVVVKADGLAAGKGVTVAFDPEAARAAVEDIFSGGPGSSLVIEDFMEGEEASFFALSDGAHAVPFGTAQDHKRAFDGDRGPNTGGMGAYSPATVVDEAMAERIMAEIIRPTLEGLARRGIRYQGVLFAGLMITADGPKLIEYNCRFGDPECQVLMLRLQTDILAIMATVADGNVAPIAPRWRAETALTVVMAAQGYPGAYARGAEIGGLAAAQALPGIHLFHAGTRRDAGRTLADGGRVLNVAALGASAEEARQRAYAGVARLDWPGGFCRSDIGWRAVERERLENPHPP